jgi:chemotaxis protein methyltransferase CheR
MNEQVPGKPSQKTLDLFSRFIAGTMGLHFREERLSELGQKIVSACGEFGFDDPEACMLWLMSTPLSREHLEILAGSLTIGETYFFRDPRSYRVLEEHVLPELKRARQKGDKRLRIWSAGCSSGEEPYSIAILLSRLLPDLDSWNITLLATDINPHVIEKGRQGVYGRWSFRDAPPWLMDYFKKKDDGRFEIVPRIRKMVQFNYLNLAEDCYPSLFNNTNAIDVIFCRNVMLYFQPEMISKVTAKFHHALHDGGWLFIGPTEAVQRPLEGFSRRNIAGTLVYRKGQGEVEETRTGEAAPLWKMPDSSLLIEKISLPPGRGGLPQHCDRTIPDTTEKKPDSVDEPSSTSIYRDACAQYEGGEYELAARKAQELRLTGEAGADVMQLLAKAYANLGRFSEARQCCEEAIAIDRLRAPNYYLLAVIMQEEGHMEEATAALNRALYVDHDYVPAYFALGNLNLQAGRKWEAQRNFANALRLLEKRDPHDVLPEADGMTAGRLAEIIRTVSQGRSVNE